MGILTDIRRKRGAFMCIDSFNPHKEAPFHAEVDNVSVLSTKNWDLKDLSPSQINPDLKVIETGNSNSVYTFLSKSVQFYFFPHSHMQPF